MSTPRTAAQSAKSLASQKMTPNPISAAPKN
jgi:hypothetical protein